MLMGFTLSLLLFFLLVRYVLPRVLRAVLGSFVRQQVHKAQQGGGFPPGFDPRGGFSGFQPPRPAGPPPTAPGQVRVEYVPPQAKEARQGEFKGGEYVDFEEVK
ncbi:DUF4834 family protein [Hymenobacter sp. RP-2-7]|uniref:DUF4834 family protein n=1 Tax=Hymenobacter polaris TaxID=2682546 RepID=A0A7Y0AHE6_9BACT|nr:hypothetical protein [Hymenobacter polaris]NML67436.1 DUF4834 family protein [Hymenobacter polaris]